MGCSGAERLALVVNTNMIAMRENHVRMFIKNPNTLFQVICFVEIVVRCPFEKRRVCKREDLVEIRVRSEVFGIAIVADPRILLGVIETKLLRSVRRGIIANNHFE